MAVYRKILKESPTQRHRVILEFSQALLAQQADPHTILDFIKQESPSHNDLPETQNLLGDLYLKCRNYPKAISHFSSSFELILAAATLHPDLHQTYRCLIELLPSPALKKAACRQIYTFSQHTPLSRDLARRINTTTAEQVLNTLCRADRDVLVRAVAERAREGSEAGEGGNVEEWGKIEQLIGESSKPGGEMSLRALLQRVDGARIGERHARSGDSD